MSVLSLVLMGTAFYGLVRAMGFDSTIADLGSQLVQLAAQLMYRLLL
jgi:hypothetical protein